jgi:hypothetical protein
MKHPSRRSLGLGAAALATSALPGAGRASAFMAEVPFLVTRNHIWTGVMLDDQGPYPFMIDTAATWYMVDPDVAAKVGLTDTGDKDRTHTAAGLIDRPIYHLRRIAIANRMSDNNLTIIGLRDDRNDITKGVIPISDKAVVGIDFDRRIMTVQRDLGRVPEGYQSFDLLNARGSPGEAARVGEPGRNRAGGAGDVEEMNATHTNHTLLTRQPIIEGQLDGRPIRLMIDTGEPDAMLIYPSYVRAHALWDHYAKTIPAVNRGLTGDVQTRIFRPERLSFGRFGFAKPIVAMADPASKGDLFHLADGVIGVEMMRRLNFIVDPDRRIAALKPSKAFDDVWRYDRAGLSLDRVGDAIQIINVVEDGPAWKSGLRKGDVVTGWAGGERLPNASPYFGLLWALQGEPGTKIGIQIDVAGKPDVVGVTLEERL